jgi:putative hemolysin
LPLTYETAQTISLVLITVLLSYVTLVLGELVPKRIARQKAEDVALALSGMVVFLSRVFQPVVWFLTISNNAILRLLRIDPDDDTKEVTEEEIRMMVDEGNVAGAIAADEKYIINNVFEFNDTQAVELMTHRTDVDLLWTEDSDAKWEETIRQSRHSHYPVVGDDADDVQGVLLSKEYFRLDRRDRESVLAGAVRPAQFVPESVMANVLFRNMKNNRNHFAVVLDEYAGMSGVITINDLLEQLVGDLDDDNTLPPDEPEFIKLSENEWEIRGTAPLDELSLELGTALPNEDYETFSGWVFGALGEVPDDGETPSVELSGLRIEITHIAEHKLERAIVQRIVKSE